MLISLCLFGGEKMITSAELLEVLTYSQVIIFKSQDRNNQLTTFQQELIDGSGK